MELMKKLEIKFGDLRIPIIISMLSMIILMTILKLYIGYVNVYGSNNYAYVSILRQNYLPDYKDEEFLSSRNEFFEDMKTALGINLIEPLSIISKEFSIMKSTQVDEAKLSYNSENSDIEVSEKIGKSVSSNTNGKSRILIYHTHTTEAFKPSKSESFYEEYNIVGVADVLKTELEKNYNVEVIHDKTIHSTSYLESYKRSGETLDKYLSEIEDFDLIIDLHRDALENKSLVTTEIDGKDVGKIMFVVAKNNPNFLENEELAIDLTTLSNDLYPGLARNVYYYEKGSNAFNQTKSSKLALIEVGAHVNTMEEVVNSAKLLANVIGEYITASKN